MDGFRHEALIYSDDDEFLAGTIPFLREGAAAGEALLVAVGPERMALLEGELGEEATAIRFADMYALGRNPARLIPFWRDLVAAQADGPVRGLGEPVWPGRGAAELEECQRHESLLNVVFAEEPELKLLCPYDGAGLDDELLAEVAHSHPHVCRQGARLESGVFEARPDCFAGTLPGCPPETPVFEFGHCGLHEVRSRVGHAALDADLPTGPAADLVAAASELAANSLVHGGGAGTLRIWREGAGLVVEVGDRGRIVEPLTGRVRPSPSQEHGRGLWLANQLCDLVQIRSGDAGTTVRLHTATR
jgi:anti-sigma regulatory factor (Ser/Thr protein kinase)